MNTSPQLDKPRRSEAGALADMSDQKMLEHVLAELVRVSDLLDVVEAHGEHEQTRRYAKYAAEYMDDAVGYIAGALKPWREDPERMQAEIEADRLSHDKDVAADLRRGE